MTRSDQLTKIWGLNPFKYDIKQNMMVNLQKRYLKLTTLNFTQNGIEQLLKTRLFKNTAFKLI